MTGRRLLRSAAPFFAAAIVSGHVGTDDVFFAGRAGPYDVRISVRQPGVIPGLADVSVRVENDGVKHVLATALRRVANFGTAPPPDTATLVAGESKLYAAQLWLMTRGAHSVIVTIDGDAGRGEVTVPVMARATRRIAMTRELGMLLAGGGLFLVVGLLTIFGAAARESVLGPDAEMAAADRRRGRWAVAVAGIVVGLLLFGGWRWIGSEARAYRARIDRPWGVKATVRGTERGRDLELTITEPLWVMRNDSAWLVQNNRYRRADLIADHGKTMHMFIVRDDDLSAFAHVHPARDGDNSFRVAFPPLPAGKYRVYADIAHEDGSSQTLVAAVDAPATAATAPAGDVQATRATPLGPRPRLGTGADPDDAWWMGTTGGPVSRLSDGSLVRWANANTPLLAGRDAELVFHVADSLGAPAGIEPYMGMRGHAMLNRADGQVFVHLHPAGTISVAAQQALAAAQGASVTHTGMAGMAMADAARPGEVRFPFVAPNAGRYRVWVQVKVAGEVRTAAFDTEVR